MTTLEILIVEDSATHVQLLKAFISQLARDQKARPIDCEFVVASSVGAARSHVALRKFDAIVLDLFLADSEPGERLIPAARGAHVVVLSGIDERHDAARLAAIRAMGPAAVLPKPSNWPAVARSVLAPWLGPPPEDDP